MSAKTRVYEYESDDQNDVIEHDCNGEITKYSLWSEEFGVHVEIPIPISLLSKSFPVSFEELRGKLVRYVDGIIDDEAENARWDAGGDV